MSYFQGDDLNKRKQDSKLVGAYEKYEVKGLADKYGITEQEVKDAIALFGRGRDVLEDYLDLKYGRL